MKVEFDQTGEDRASLVCHKKGGGGGGGGVVDSAENPEGNEQGMSEIIVQLEDEPLHMSQETDSSPENDIYLFAPVSDFEDGEHYDSDSSSVPAGKQSTLLPSDMNVIKLEECAEGSDAISRTDKKPKRKKNNSPSAKHSRPISSSTNGQAKRRGKKKSQVKTQPCELGQAEQECRMSGETASRIPAPFTKSEAVISPQAAMEAPGFPSLQGKVEEPICDKKDTVLLEVLKYCQTLCTVVQRLEQKIDRLQADCSQLHLFINKENTKEPCTSSVLRTDQLPLRGGSFQCRIPINANTFTSVFPPDPGYFEEANKADTSRIAQQRGRGRGGGGRRGRPPGRGRSQAASRQKDPPYKNKEPPVRVNQPKRRVSLPVPGDDDGPCASKVAKILSELQGRRSAVGASVEERHEATKNESTSDGNEQQVMIGSAFRKVWIPYSVYMEAFKQDEPQKAVVPVLHAVFPQSVLSCSAVIGNPQRGIQELSPNKLEAIREWLAEMYPRHELEVKGKAWAECLGVLNSITRKLKSDTTPTKNTSPKVP